MSIPARVVVAIAATCLLAAVAVTLAPVSGGGYGCGTWVAPEMSAATVSNLPTGLGAGLDARVYALEAAYVECSAALDARRTWALVFLGGAIVLPALVLFVAQGRKTAF